MVVVVEGVVHVAAIVVGVAAVVVDFVDYELVLVPTRHIDDTIVPTVDNRRPHLDIYESFWKRPPN
jgi:hypothetical protein